jgi:hypothetical protein
MRTRDVLRWHWSVRDLGELVLICAGGLVLGVLDAACTRVERWIDARRRVASALRREQEIQETGERIADGLYALCEDIGLDPSSGHGKAFYDAATQSAALAVIRHRRMCGKPL